MHADIAIKNALILTVNNEDEVIQNGTIIIIGNIIEEIGSAEVLEKYQPEKIIDAKGKLVMPGMVNSHTHAAMTIFRGMADDMPLDVWLNEHIFPAEAKYVTAESVELGTRLAILEMVRSGTTTFADMYYFENVVAQVCKDVGVRGLLGEGILGFPVPSHPTSEGALQFTEELIQEYKNDELISIAVGPHAPYTCPEYLLKECRELANKYSVPLHIHLSETMKEYEECIKQTGVTPVQYMERAGILDGHTIAAHCVFASEDDVAVMAKWNTKVAHNPQCNMKLVSGVAPVLNFQNAGLTVGLGTDGVVSNNNLDMFEEMKTCSLIHKLRSNDPAAMNATKVIRMATIEGAKALGMGDKIGSLEKGKRADLLIINTDQPHLVPMYNVFSQVVYSLKGNDVETVMVNGRIIMENNHIHHIDEQKIKQDIQVFANKVMADKANN